MQLLLFFVAGIFICFFFIQETQLSEYFSSGQRMQGSDDGLRAPSGQMWQLVHSGTISCKNVIN